jgi:lipopolysaccharide/colanic/teichoic acid biosynthesis glycosyltransferase
MPAVCPKTRLEQGNICRLACVSDRLRCRRDDWGMREQADAYMAVVEDESLFLEECKTELIEKADAGAAETPWPDDHGQVERVRRKRILDLVVGIPAVLLFLPLCLLIAVAIMLDSGRPVLFRQKRVGLHGKSFRILKFRTMDVTEDAPRIFPQKQGGPRVTRIGWLLRPLGLDELPQLLNVLSGEMSLVGPRPHEVAEDQHYAARIPNYGYRRRVRPGITGWAQVHGARGTTRRPSDMEARIEFDAWYVDHGTLILDLLILAATPLAILRGQRRS